MANLPNGTSNNGTYAPLAAPNGQTNMNGNILPSAGHYADMQTLMASMETLSGWLQQNREEWAQLQEGLGRVERLHPGTLSAAGIEHVGVANGDGGEVQQAVAPRSTDDDGERPTLTALQTQLSASHSRISSLESQLRSQETLQTLYESTLTDATDRIRQYCFSQQSYITSLHSHYLGLLEQSREEVVEAQLVHQGWQEGLGRLSGMVREALRSSEEAGLPWVGEVRGLREENRRLRKMVGWSEPEPSSEEEGEEREGYGQRRRERGRASQGSNEAVRGDEGGGGG
ncbi:hypothetical protein LTR56_018598 [Elasticomyces elasticus]|nr:hypothetical protein LTR56_018598 [Elasticomyces elasticus]KAK3647373.1 hypothetical protein LTR22_013804 [Elasticomyces elasticus]KAK5752040.1 hypothetical protein LTS12_017890 [Elasticomyces elasticus]